MKKEINLGDETMDRNLEELVEFFKNDVEIKKLLYQSTPPILITEEDCIDYSNRLEEISNDISFRINTILSQPSFGFPEDVRDLIKQKMKDIKKRIQETSMKKNDLEATCRGYVSEMSLKFVQDVGNVCIGYTRNEHCYQDGSLINLLDVAQSACTLNELIHLVHSYVCNKAEILENIPMIAQKKMGTYGDCKIMGVGTDIALDIFNSLPENDPACELGEIFIVGLEDRVLMMVRDSGHALTMDIEPDEARGKAFVKYFIPKICNPEKLNRLKGIHKVPVTSHWSDLTATGAYEAPLDGFGQDLLEFIHQVPTDADIQFQPPEILLKNAVPVQEVVSSEPILVETPLQELPQEEEPEERPLTRLERLKQTKNGLVKIYQQKKELLAQLLSKRPQPNQDVGRDSNEWR